MTCSVGCVAKGETFLKLIVPLVLRRIPEIEPVLFVYRHRSGKSYDDVKPDSLAELHSLYRSLHHDDLRIQLVNDDNDLVTQLSSTGITNVICQDAQHHFPFLFSAGFNVLSLAMFTDTLHFASGNSNNTSRHPKQSMTCFPDEITRSLTEQFSSVSWNGIVTGSPLFDNLEFMSRDAALVSDCLFLLPPQALLTDPFLSDIKDLCLHSTRSGYRFTMLSKPRYAVPERLLAAGAVLLDNERLGFCYTSLLAIASSAIVVSSFSIAAFEAQHLGTPMINIDIDERSSCGNARVKQYDMREIYDTGYVKTVQSCDLVSTFDEMINHVQQDKKKLVGSGASKRIWQEVLRINK